MPTTLGNPRLVAQTGDVIGEVPVWDARTGSLYWADILKPAFHRLSDSGEVTSWTPPEKLGSYALTAGAEVLVAGRGGMALWTPGSDAFERLSTPEADRPDNILNDGRTDPRGRFVVASMDKMLAGPNGRMWLVTARETRLMQDDEIFLPNSICWSPDGTTLYLGDSHSNLIFAYDYDLASGGIANRRLFADTADLPGVVDGSSVDAEGYLWNARFGGGCLIRFAPDGRVDRTLRVPVSQPTHVTFGGPDLRTMYVTTARFRLKPDVLAAEPMTGGLLALESEVAGLPDRLWG